MEVLNLTTYVALLRGINVGGKTLISMAELKECFEALGFVDVKTYSNSGNVIFRTHEGGARKLEARIEPAIKQCFGLPVNVVVHSLPEVSQILVHLPKSWHSPGERKCNVIFLRHPIDHCGILTHFTPKAEIEELHYFPGVLFWSAQTSALTKSTMIKLSGSPLYKEMTVRILATVQKIHVIMQQTDQLLKK